MLPTASGVPTMAISAKWTPREALAPLVEASHCDRIAELANAKRRARKYAILMTNGVPNENKRGSTAPSRQPKTEEPANANTGGSNKSHTASRRKTA